MVTDEIQELLEGTMDDGRMAELLHTLSVSPEKRKAFRDHLLLNQEMKDDRYASALTFSEDSAVWESIAAAGAFTATTASTAGRAIGAWAGRVAALVVVGVAGYILGSNTSTTVVNNAGADNAPVASPTGASGASTSSATQSPSTQGSAASGSVTSGSTGGGISSAGQASSPVAASPVAASPAIAQSFSRTSPQRSAGSMQGTGSMAIRSGVASSRSGRNDLPQTSAQSAPAGSVEVAREMFDAMGGSSAMSDAWNIPMVAIGDTAPAAARTTTHDGANASGAAHGGSPSSAPKTADTAAGRTEAALRRSPIPEDIPIEGGEGRAPVSAFFHNGFESGFSERLGMLVTGSNVGTDNADRSFSYHAIDLGYRLNGGALGFGIRLGYGTFSRVQLDTVPLTRDNEAGIVDMVTYSSSLVAVRRMSGELFVNYRHPLTERIALGLEAFIGGSSSHQQGGVDLSMVAFLTERFGLQLGAGAGTYWYRIDQEWTDATKDRPNAAIDFNAKTAYSGVMLVGRYGLFYRF